MSFLEASSLSFGYPRKESLFENLSLIIKRGDRIALRGPNGAGKTTLFRIFMGLLTPSGGGILLEGVPVRTSSQWRYLRNVVGLLFQDSEDQLFCPTLLEDVAFGPRNMGIPPKEARSLALEVLQRLGMEKHAEAPPHTLSGGEKKLGALGTLLSMNPQLLLLDEPATALDEKARKRLIRVLWEFPGMLCVASHDEAFLREVAERDVELREGRIVERFSLTCDTE